MKWSTSATPVAAATSGRPTPIVVRSDDLDRSAMTNSRTTLSSPSRRHRSSATAAALTATGSVTSGSDAISRARLSARTLNIVARAAISRVPSRPERAGSGRCCELTDIRRSSLRAGKRDSLYECALGQEEQDDDRGGRRGGPRHHPGPVGRVVTEISSRPSESGYDD